MRAASSQRARRVAGLAGLLGTAVLLVAGKAATAPPTHRIVLATPSTPPPASAGPPSIAGPPASAGLPSIAGPPASAGPPSSAGPPARTTPRTTTKSVPTPAPAVAAPRTVLGQAESNPYGTVQVKVTFAGGRITDVRAVQLPSGGRSGEIAAYAAPRLRAEVLAAQSANIDTVSGASYTSDGYARSVQSALDAAPK